MAVFQAMLPPTATRPKSQYWSGPSKLNILRDAIGVSTWIALGAVLQSLLVALAPFQWAVLPPAVYLATQIIDTLLIWGGVRANPALAGVVDGKVSAQFPGSTAPSQQTVAVIQLAARSNHALGALHPYFLTIGGYFDRMIADLEARSAEKDDNGDEGFGYLGARSFLANDRAASNEVMVQIYFRSYAGLHRFAHAAGGVHREAWDYWSTVVAGKASTVGHLFSIMHEAYEVPAQHWESIYINYQPTGLGATSFRGTDGRAQWASPLVDAHAGLLRTSKGRRAATHEDDRD
ncbi:uncharacterized protein SPSK_03541 [Sporothrix schenckii 1099-18]|uniref:Uncharacterized protein n=1 Tax=Sporothrix schenckii 1099-18 TaxID=1397361 RepID=A0A0F2M1L6_SPOSC|nr:uncharacterized protein SPSK_03541 [Sporothrix schenckii 1099-18]KJR82036.1 hypothetical protein SPSK_03541 [Sporothrix schenckii 1099-18]